jgi:hypothetical protein
VKRDFRFGGWHQNYQIVYSSIGSPSTITPGVGIGSPTTPLKVLEQQLALGINQQAMFAGMVV